MLNGNSNNGDLSTRGKSQFGAVMTGTVYQSRDGNMDGHFLKGFSKKAEGCHVL
jgi:hypothetical protein